MNLPRSPLFKGIVHLALFIALCVLVARHLWIDDGWTRFTFIWKEALDWAFFFVLLLVCWMSLLNWWMEANKWKILHPSLSFMDAWKTVWIGQTIGFVTPFHLGDFLGRSHAMGWTHWKRSAYHTFLCSWAQNGVNVIVGILFLWTLSNPWTPLISKGWWALIFAMVFILAYIYLYGERWISQWLPQKVSVMVKIHLTGWSLLRYTIYLLQYFITLQALGLNWTGSLVLVALATLFLVQSGLPLPPALVALARVELAILIFSYEGANELIVWSAALIVWVVNVLIPVIIGYFWTIRHKGYATND